MEKIELYSNKGGSQQRILRLAKEYAGGYFEIGLVIKTTPARS